MGKPERGWPMFFGIDHYEGGGKGMKEGLASVARPGARCFIECDPKEVEFYNEGGQILAAPTSNMQTYNELMGWLHERGVELVALDKESILRVYKRAQGNESLQDYVGDVVRERGWVNKVRVQSRKEDFVIMHPGHLARIRMNFRIPINRCVFVDKIKKEWRQWINSAYDNRLKALRRQERARKAQSRPPARQHTKK